MEAFSLPLPKRPRACSRWKLQPSSAVIDVDCELQQQVLVALPGETDAAFASRLQMTLRQAEADYEQRRLADDCAFARHLQETWLQGEVQLLAKTPTERPSSLAALVGLPLWAPPMIPEVPRLCTHNIDLRRHVQVLGTQREPFLHARNVDGQRGRLLAGRVLNELRCQGLCLSLPEGRVRSGIVVQKHAQRRAANPWRTGIRVLHDLADSIREDLAQTHGAEVPDLRRPHRGWSDSEVMVSGPGFQLKRHTDLQPSGSLLFIFSIGLTSNSQAWPCGVLKEARLESGDLMILDGKRTAHAVPSLVPRSSPFPSCPWLGTRRLVVLVREIAPS